MKKPSIHSVYAYRDVSPDEPEVEYLVSFMYRPGSSDYYNRSGGHWEHGWAAEIELIDILEPVFGTTQDKAEAMIWAEKWIESSIGYNKACDAAVMDRN